MSQAALSDQPQASDVVQEPLEPEPESVVVYDCPLEHCDTRSNTERGFRMHLTRADDHDDSLARATMRCAHCGATFEAQQSEMDRAYCSKDCAYDDGRGADPTVLDGILDPVVTSEVRYPCTAEGCDYVADSEFGFRRHATAQHDRGRVPIDCEVCGETFDAPASEADTSQYCSLDCKGEAMRDRVEIVCETCGDVFDVIASREDSARFCSERCRDDAKRRRVSLCCQECGDEFEVVRYRAEEAMYCSRECLTDANRRPRVWRECTWCGDQFKTVVRPSSEHRFCDPSCSLEWFLTVHCQPSPDISNYEPEELGLSPFGEVAERQEMPHAPAIVSYRISRQECLEWRRSVLAANTLDAVLQDRTLPSEVVREHITGECHHGFDIVEQPPLRYNGDEWASAGRLWGGQNES